jgi:hypothetical protein
MRTYSNEPNRATVAQDLEVFRGWPHSSRNSALQEPRGNDADTQD